jgi:hypothetical protein
MFKCPAAFNAWQLQSVILLHKAAALVSAKNFQSHQKRKMFLKIFYMNMLMTLLLANSG